MAQICKLKWSEMLRLEFRIHLYQYYHRMQSEPLRIKLVVVGDGTVGKTCILLSFAKNEFPKEYEPTVFDNLTTTLRIDGQLINLGLWDTAGQEEYSTLRQLAYPGTDIFLIIFSVNSPDSFINARKKWYPEIMQCVPNATIAFVGNKIDLRDNINQGKNFIQKEQARKVIQQETKCPYFQCSALTQVGLKELFEESAKIIINKKLGGKVQKKMQKAGTKSEFCNLI